MTPSKKRASANESSLQPASLNCAPTRLVPIPQENALYKIHCVSHGQERTTYTKTLPKPSTQSKQSQPYRSAALPLPTVVAPVSDAFETVVARAGVRELLVPDGKHPNGRAVYLDAALLYGLFFGTSPRDLPDLYVPSAAAAGLRDAAALALGY